MAGFDISTLLNFKPAKYQCERCLGLLPNGLKLLSRKSGDILKCPICDAEYLGTDGWPLHEWRGYLESQDLTLEIPNLIEHCRSFARIAKRLRSPDELDLYPPMRALLEALSTAQSFVHLVSYGISFDMIGVLKLLAQRVPVRAVLSMVNSDARVLLTEHTSEAPRLEVRIFDTHDPGQQVPHQKLIVVDGIIAFKGSANLTGWAWRKATEDREIIEVVTDLNEVIELHNRYFSRLWVEGGKTEPRILMGMGSLPF